MSVLRRGIFISIIVLILALFIGRTQWFLTETTLTHSIERKYFGKDELTSSSTEEETEIKPFRIPYDHQQVVDVVHRLKETRFNQNQIVTNQRNSNKTTYGFPRSVAQSIQQYWINKYDWKETVNDLNKFDHFKTNIDGLNIHFIRIRRTFKDSSEKQAILFLHGWPSSFLEFLDVARTMNASSISNYDFIIPSLPGFGYSDAPLRSGLGPAQIGVLMNVLMERLGYSSYIICASDWGSLIGTYMTHLYPTRIRGFFTTMVMPNLSLKGFLRILLAHSMSPWFLFGEDEISFFNEKFDIFKSFKFLWKESGYFHIQSTKPDTIGYALNDSPLGLATYILEKWSRWSNSEEEIDQSENAGLDRFNLDQLISTVMLYWTTGSITSSMRIYFEDMQSTFSEQILSLFSGPIPSSIPVAIVNYRHEVLYVPRIIAEEKYPNIRLWIFHNDGGHFAALEQFPVYVRDLERFLLIL